MTSEQLEAARAERMRQNGIGTLTLEDARTWIEETGLCLFLPRRQFSSSVAPSFVEAVAGQRDATPDQRHIAAAEDLLVRMEAENIAVRLNLQGQPGEQPDFVVAAWVLPYVYALRGDRDWRRNPQLTGSRAVSPLAVQAYKLLEGNDSTIAQLKQALGREVSESAVVRAITELWQQLRIIPVISEPGRAAKWQLLRHRYQKAIAEGASTSQVTAISVLASIYLQAVISATMEEVEIFLSPLTSRSKIREVLRGLVATRQVHTLSVGHAPHFYVAGTLPEFSPVPAIYAGAGVSMNGYYSRAFDHDEVPVSPAISYSVSYSAPSPVESRPVFEPRPSEPVAPHTEAAEKPAARPAAPRPRFSRPAAHSRDRKPAQASSGSRIARRTPEARTAASRSSNGAHPGSSTRWSSSRPVNGKTSGSHTPKNHAKNGSAISHGAHTTNGAHGANGTRNGKSSAPAWAKHNGHAKNGSSLAKPSANGRNSVHAHKETRSDARAVRSTHKPTLTAGAKAGNSKRFGFTARAKQGTKKRG